MRVVVDDLAFFPTDAIVRPATTQLEPTTAALRRLEQMGGPEFLRHLELHTELDVGAAVVTAAGGDLPAEFLIHAIILSQHEAISHRGVSRAWRNWPCTPFGFFTGSGNSLRVSPVRILSTRSSEGSPFWTKSTWSFPIICAVWISQPFGAS